ncbi:MAG: hypothetical protein H6563_11060 [Lewinellaceae bacterium]|nr:hypothetical protein [Lewinellaceae bacterium]
MLNLSRRVPVVYLGALEGLIMDKVDQDGVAPYYSIIIDYIERYANAPQDSTLDRFNNFTMEISQKINMDERGESFVLVRSLLKEEETLYKENLGRILTKMSTSDFGKAQFFNGMKADLFTRLIAAASNCEKYRGDGHFPNEIAQLTCNKLQEILEQSLCDPNSGKDQNCDEGKSNLANAIEYVNGGEALGAISCFKKEDPYISFSSQFMQYVSCQSKQFSNPFGNFDSSPFAIGGTEEYPPHEYGSTAMKKLLKDLDYDGSAETTAPHKNGVTTQISYSYSKSDGTSVQVIDYTTQSGSSWANSTTTQVGTMVVVNDRNGRSIYHYDQNGSLIGSEYYGDDGTGNTVGIHTSYQDNGFIDREVYADGNAGTVTVTQYDEEGNIEKQTVYDVTTGDEPKCVSGCDDPATFNDDSTPEFEFDPCYETIYGQNQKVRELHHSNPNDLGPWIQPDPEKVSPDHIMVCLHEMANSPWVNCGPSVVLCLDEVDDICKCVSFSNIPLFQGGYCNEINCGEGIACDPGTGMCKPEGELPFIGILDPLPVPNVGIALTPGVDVQAFRN